MKILAIIFTVVCVVGIIVDLAMLIALYSIVPQLNVVWTACILAFVIGIYFNVKILKEYPFH